MAIEFGTASASLGERSTGWLFIGEDRDGSTFELPVAIINGSKPGKTLYVQAANDGNELNGIGVINRIVPQINPEEIAGQLLFVGIVNYHGFHANKHRNPLDDWKINRVYPGDENGSPSERIAHKITNVIKDVDLILDLHQASTSRMIHEVRIRCGRRHRLHNECMELAKVFGCGHIYDQKGPMGQLARVGPNNGIPTVDPELGGSVGWDHESIRRGVCGIWNVLAYYGFTDQSFDINEQVCATNMDHYGSPSGGFVKYEKDLGDEVSVGDVLFRITSAFGEQKATVRADTDGIFWRTRRLPQVSSGEYVCSIGTNTISV
jgi:uncharacterized protein